MQDRSTTTRYCIKDPIKGWIRLSQADFDRLGFQNAPKPEFADKCIDICVADVQLEGNRIIEIATIRKVTWLFDAHGRLDQLARAQMIAKKMNKTLTDSEKPFELTDIRGIRNAFKLP